MPSPRAFKMKNWEYTLLEVEKTAMVRPVWGEKVIKWKMKPLRLFFRRAEPAVVKRARLSLSLAPLSFGHISDRESEQWFKHIRLSFSFYLWSPSVRTPLLSLYPLKTSVLFPVLVLKITSKRISTMRFFQHFGFLFCWVCFCSRSKTTLIYLQELSNRIWSHFALALILYMDAWQVWAKIQNYFFFYNYNYNYFMYQVKLNQLFLF